MQKGIKTFFTLMWNIVNLNDYFQIKHYSQLTLQEIDIVAEVFEYIYIDEKLTLEFFFDEVVREKKKA